VENPFKKSFYEGERNNPLVGKGSKTKEGVLLMREIPAYLLVLI
jgi:hypothetical protein